MKSHWSKAVSEQSKALDLEPGIFTLDDPCQIALALKDAAEASQCRQADPFCSALAMLNFYINRAGSKLPAERRALLEQAKNELRLLYGRPRRHL
ncbi:DUF3175 domain-containing protein [Gallaecimonas kandeliae]|uniref:DUF3175 domain-containing protein n=1 Tax=Gallaecimonas kandeliae TaxID=3029055 RepID=UPI00264A3C25|nr:DUF3175 domain-containing protein [Gallaecimonas kandeliae]WKE66899.1 DUF3175 domain-containing protein [Gallaecimonas kandeliae]